MGIFDYLESKKNNAIKFGAGVLAVGTILTTTSCMDKSQDYTESLQQSELEVVETYGYDKNEISKHSCENYETTTKYIYGIENNSDGYKELVTYLVKYCDKCNEELDREKVFWLTKSGGPLTQEDYPFDMA